jgi:hypothetical protein
LWSKLFPTGVDNLEVDLPNVKSLLHGRGYQLDAPSAKRKGSSKSVFYLTDSALAFRYFGRGPKSAQNLQNEYYMLEELYGDQLYLDPVSCGSSKIHGLVMTKLDHCLVEKVDTLAIIPNFQMTRTSLGKEQLTHRTFDNMIDLGKSAITEFLKTGLYTNKTAAKLYGDFDSLLYKWNSSDRKLCHGDLSNENIMSLNHTNFVIDWEDTFIGPPSFDFLYWLTFRSNVSTITYEDLTRFENDTDTSISILELIITLKEFIHLKYRRDESMKRASPEARIKELGNYLGLSM